MHLRTRAEGGTGGLAIVSEAGRAHRLDRAPPHGAQRADGACTPAPPQNESAVPRRRRQREQQPKESQSCKRLSF